MSDIAYWNLTSKLDMLGELEKLEWPGHVWAGDQTCPTMVTGTRSGIQIFLASW
jgi:hypothetical protein